MDEKALAYVTRILRAHGDLVRAEQPFRTRSGHIRRVCLWVERLLSQGGDVDTAALRLAAAFHDVGYVHGEAEHGRHSARMLLRYAKEAGIPAQTAEHAAFLVREHSNKEKWLKAPHAPRALVLLMEADLLDEEGAMGLALDCLTAGANGLGYEGARARMLRYEPSRLAQNPMVTPLGKAYWAEKQRIIRLFMEAYAFDLGADDEA